MDTLSPITPEQLKAKVAATPALPPLAVDLLTSFDQETIDVATLARRLASDQTLAARALRIANSPLYGLERQISSIQEAIIVLGMRTVRSLIIAAAMVDSLSGLAAVFDRRRYWRHSIGVALCARELARRTNENPDTAFTVGLLHDMGHVLLAASFPQHYAKANDLRHEKGLSEEEAEMAVFGIDHLQAGGMLARQWKLPERFVDAITRHNAPDEGQQNTLADLTHAANVLAIALELDHDCETSVPPLAPKAWSRLQIDWQKMPTLFVKIERDFEETCLALVP